MKQFPLSCGVLVTAISVSVDAQWSNTDTLSQIPGKAAYAISRPADNGTRSIQLGYLCKESTRQYFLLSDFPIPTRTWSGVEFAQAELAFDGEAVTVNLYPNSNHFEFGEQWAVKDKFVTSKEMTVKVDWTDFNIDMTGSAIALFAADNQC